MKECTNMCKVSTLTYTGLVIAGVSIPLAGCVLLDGGAMCDTAGYLCGIAGFALLAFAGRMVVVLYRSQGEQCRTDAQEGKGE